MCQQAPAERAHTVHGSAREYEVACVSDLLRRRRLGESNVFGGFALFADLYVPVPCCT